MSETDFSIKFKNHRCFRDEFAGFDRIKPVNIIIGRNNSGKSCLLDILEFAMHENKRNDGVVLQIEDVFKVAELKHVFPEGVRGGELGSGSSHWDDHGQHLLELRACYEIEQHKSVKHEWVNPDIFEQQLGGSHQNGIGIQIGRTPDVSAVRRRMMDEFMGRGGKRVPEFFTNKTIRRMSAERDIAPEHASSARLLEANGRGATNIIRAYLLETGFKQDVMERELLDALNSIFRPDNEFKRINVQVNSVNDEWEVYLEEEVKDWIPLTESGSGLKTVILVLLNLLVMQKHGNQGIERYLFAFEELENNVHPALLRRLFRYIEDFAIEKKCHFFITTHSNVVIDLFSRSPHAQIIHVRHDGKRATTTTIDSFADHGAVLDDLGVKASDILQANGIVWVEGPSDRIYFNRWVELFSDGKLREHRDYECAFYGGAVLKHFEAAEPEQEGDAINVLKINRNAILIGDSDKTSAEQPLKTSLSRMKEELEGIGGHVWVTETKEIENYIPAAALVAVFNKPDLEEVGQYERFCHRGNEGTDNCGYWQQNELPGSLDKIQLARDVSEHLTKDNLEERHDLPQQMTQICEIITGWNDTKP